MTIKQKQWQLYFLGYYTGAIDGIWGKQSREATLAFQKDSFTYSGAHDGIFGDSSAGKSQEIIDRIQDILIATVDSSLKDDGLAGPKTMAALKLFQESKGLPQTGRVDDTTWDMLMQETPATEEPEEPVPEVDTDSGGSSLTITFWPGIVYFTRQELRCKCGGQFCDGFPAEPQELLVRLAERARVHFGAPAHNVSCLRCPTWNARCGGVANSQHMYGKAMDIRIDGVTADALFAFFKAQPEVRYAYKINDTNVHFDIPKGER